MEQDSEQQDSMDAPEVIDRLEDLALSGREGYVCIFFNNESNESTPNYTRPFCAHMKVAHVCFDNNFLSVVCLQVPNRYTVPLRQGIDINDLIQGDGTMFETDLDNMGKLVDQ